MISIWQTLARIVFLFGLACIVTAARAEPQNGWWWNPDESGRGFFIEARNGVLVLGGYFYEEDGRATWIHSGGPITDAYTYQGTLQAYRNGQSVFGTYRAPTSVDVGPVALKFSDDAHATLAWPGGQMRLEREMFGTEEPIVPALFALQRPPFRPQTGWWWNEAESGTGFSLEVQGSNVFVVAFMYDDSGNPVWYYTAGPMASPTHYEGDWLLFSGGQTLTGPYRAPDRPQALGRIIIDFISDQEATIEFQEASPVKTTPRSKKKTVKTQNPSVSWPYSAQWPKWTGRVEVVYDKTTPSWHEDESLTYDVTLLLDPPTLSSWVYTYSDDETSKFTYRYRFSDFETGCSQRGDLTTIGEATAGLILYDDLTYVGYVGDRSTVAGPNGIAVDIYETCPDEENGGTRTYLLYTAPIADYIQFGASRAYGGISRVVDFYPAYGYQPGRTAPVIKGAERYKPIDRFFLKWSLIAP